MPAARPVNRLVIVGGSAAGLAVVEEVRRRGFPGRIIVIDSERGLPYDRPPLSKQLLTGEWAVERLLLRPRDRWEALAVEHVTGAPAVAVDTEAAIVRLADGAEVGYDALVIATGSQAIHPDSLGRGIAGVQTLRTLRDALALREALLSGGPLVIVGAGFVGAEAAAVARGMDVPVAMVDPLPLPMVNVLGEQAAGMLADRHRAAGVDMRCGTAVSEVISRDGRVTAVALDDGGTIEAATVLVAVGARPAVDWLAGSGIPLGSRTGDGTDGVLCDAYGQATTQIWAAGDVAAWLDPATGHRHRSEHRLAAAEQGRAVGAALLGEQPPALSVSYFWSDQYDLKLQSYGATGRQMQFSVVEGSLAEGRFVAVYGHRDADGHAHRVDGVLACGMVRELHTWRKALVEKAPWPHSRHDQPAAATAAATHPSKAT